MTAAVIPAERLFARNLPVQQTLDCDEVLSFGLGALLVAAHQLAGVFRGERGHDPSTRTPHDPGRNRHTYESNACLRRPIRCTFPVGCARAANEPRRFSRDAVCLAGLTAR